MDLLPVAEFRRLDLNSAECGVPVSKLMARAGKALAKGAMGLRKREVPVWFVCGKGNNGGDGFAAALLLHRQGVEVKVLLVEPAENVASVEAKAYLELLPAELVENWRNDLAPAAHTVIVDCLLGSGITGNPRPPYDAALSWLREARRRRRPILACDMPSAFGTKYAVKPRATVTFHAAKEGMNATTCGEIEVADIGIPAAAKEIGIGDLDLAFKRRAADSHKGQNGVILVIGGGPFVGAPYYSAMAAYRTGADLVFIATTASAAATISAWGPDPLVHAVGQGPFLVAGDFPKIKELADRANAIVLGPGIGTEPATMELCKKVIEAYGARKPVVIDADALQAVGGQMSKCIVTPHGKEFARMGGKTGKSAVAKLAADLGCVVVCKGAVDVVSDGISTRKCMRGNPTMTVGGTGDALAGAIAQLAATASPFEAACAGAYLLGRAGELAAAQRGVGATTLDIIDEIATIMRSL